MTELERIVRRRVRTLDGAPLVISLTLEGISIRQPRKRMSYLLPFATAYQWAAELKVGGGRIAKPRRKRVR